MGEGAAPGISMPERTKNHSFQGGGTVSIAASKGAPNSPGDSKIRWNPASKSA